MAKLATPFLMFEGRAEEALNFYIRVIPDSRIDELRRYGPEGPGKAGSIMVGRATLGGLAVMVSDSPVHHAFTFTPSLSLFLETRSDQEFDAIVADLAEGGGFLMAPGDYGFSRRFAWLADRFGVSWQINLDWKEQ
jgi:predicted 3-demethylubiquinone-9 3-methyltransferase (glyoxalase superfamily)